MVTTVVGSGWVSPDAALLQGNKVIATFPGVSMLRAAALQPRVHVSLSCFCI